MARYTQIAIVCSTKKKKALFCLLEKGRRGWKIKMKCPAYIGKNGMGKKKEGDGKTPVGLYYLTEAFGRKKNPGTALAYTRLTPRHYWCTDEESACYNRMVERTSAEPLRGEALCRYKKEYRYAVWINYNREKVPGRGSAIFLHCMGDKKYTEGCVAISAKNMKKFLLYAAGELPILLF